MDVAAFEHTQRNRQKCEHYTLSMYTSDHVLLVDTSAEFCWVRQNEAKAFAPDEPWKWQWMLRHLNTHRETGKNVSSLSKAPFVASCSQQMTLLLSVAEFVKMKRQHLHLMIHGNGNCGIWTHTEKQPKTWAVCPTLRSLHHVRNKSNKVACMRESSQNAVAKKSEPLPRASSRRRPQSPRRHLGTRCATRAGPVP